MQHGELLRTRCVRIALEISNSKWRNANGGRNQEVDVVYTVFYRVPADRVAYIFTNNRDYESRLAAMTVDRLKAAMGQVNVQSVAEKRGELRDTIKATLDHDVIVPGLRGAGQRSIHSTNDPPLSVTTSTRRTRSL